MCTGPWRRFSSPRAGLPGHQLLESFRTLFGEMGFDGTEQACGGRLSFRKNVFRGIDGKDYTAFNENGFIPSRLHLHIFVVSSSYSSTSIPRRRLDLLLNATWYDLLAQGAFIANLKKTILRLSF